MRQKPRTTVAEIIENKYVQNSIVNVREKDSTVGSPSGSFGNQWSPALPLLHLTRQLSRPVAPGPDRVGAVGGTRPWRSLRCRHLQGPVEPDFDNLEDEELRDRCSCDGRADKGALEPERDLASVDMEAGVRILLHDYHLRAVHPDAARLKNLDQDLYTCKFPYICTNCPLEPLDAAAGAAQRAQRRQRG